jgi:hypothetical protein
MIALIIKIAMIIYTLRIWIMYSGHWWLKPVIPATQEAEIGRIVVQDKFGQKVGEIPISSHTHVILAILEA